MMGGDGWRKGTNERERWMEKVIRKRWVEKGRRAENDDEEGRDGCEEWRRWM